MRKMKKVLKDRICLSVIPLVVSGIAICFLYRYLVKINFSVDSIQMKDIISTMLNIWITFFGFIITALSILIAFNGSKYTEVIRESGHYKTIVFLYIFTCTILFIALVAMLPIYIINLYTLKTLILLIFFIILSLIMFLLDIVLLFLILGTIKS